MEKQSCCNSSCKEPLPCPPGFVARVKCPKCGTWNDVASQTGFRIGWNELIGLIDKNQIKEAIDANNKLLEKPGNENFAYVHYMELVLTLFQKCNYNVYLGEKIQDKKPIKSPVGRLVFSPHWNAIDPNTDVGKSYRDEFKRLKHIIRKARGRRVIRAWVLSLLLAVALAGVIFRFVDIPRVDTATGVQIEANLWTVGSGVTPQVEAVPKNTPEDERIGEQLGDEVKAFKAYQIAMPHRGKGSMTVSLPMDGQMDPNLATVFYVSPQGEVEEFDTVLSEDKKAISFETTHFSLYVLAEKRGKGLVYQKKNDGTYAVETFTGGSRVEIPALHNGKPVTEIMAGAFSGRDDLWEVSVPETVTKIGNEAFQNCTNITSLTIPASVESLGVGVFSGWSGRQTISFAGRPDGTLPGAWQDNCLATVRYEMSTVSFDGNGAEGQMPSQTGSGDGTLTLSQNTFTKIGYHFVGWSDAPDGLKKYDDQDKMSLQSYNDYRLYALFEANRYSVVFDANAGQGALEALSCQYGSPVTLPDGRTLSRTGYAFTGWQIGHDTYQAGGQVSSLTDQPDAVLTAVAQWTPIPYAISFDMGGGAWASGTAAQSCYTVEMGDFRLPADIVRTGYTFMGWRDGTNGEVVSSIPAGSVGDRRFSAMWEANRYTVRFSASDISITLDDMACEYDREAGLPDISRYAPEGVQFAGWRISGKTYSVGQTVKNLTDKSGAMLLAEAVWTYPEYRITYDLKGGHFENEAAVCRTYTMKSGLILLTQQVAKDGYTFQGWKDAESGKLVTSISGGTTGNRSFVAEWKPITYTLAFDIAGGKGSVPSSLSCQYDKETVLPDGSKLTRSGYTFGGWKIGDRVYSSGEIVVNLTVKNEDRLTAQAVWNVMTYRITFETDGGVFDATADVRDRYSVESSQYVLPVNIKKTGYTLTGWWDSSVGRYATTLNSGTIGDKVFKANWKANTYTLKFELNGDSFGRVKELVCQYDKEVKLPGKSDVSRTGYTFTGWRIAEKDYEPGDSVKNLATEGTLTATAQWKVNTYQVIFHANTPRNAGQTLANQYATWIFDTSIALKAASSLPHYVFKGWYLNADGRESGRVGDAGQTLSKIAGCVPNDVDGTVTLYAKWEPDHYTVRYDPSKPATASGQVVLGQVTDTWYYGDGNAYPVAPVLYGWIFKGWCWNGTLVRESEIFSLLRSSSLKNGDEIYLTAQWEAEDVKVVWRDANGEQTKTVKYDSQLDVSALTVGKKTGYTFAGFYTDSACTSKASDILRVNDSLAVKQYGQWVLNLYVKWSLNQYTISYQPNGGTVSEQATRYHVEQNSFSIPQPVYGKCSEYISFMGWYEDSSLTKPFDERSLKTNPRNLTLYAKWSVDDIYTFANTPAVIQKDCVILDWSGSVAGQCKCEKTIKITNATQIVLIGNPLSTYCDLTLELCAKSSAKTNVSFCMKNFQMQGVLHQTADYYSLNVTLDVSGVNEIHAPSKTGKVAIDGFDTLTFTGSGTLDVFGSDGVDGVVTGSSGTSGAAAIVANNLIFDTVGSITVTGGTGGDAYNRSSGDNGGEGHNGRDGYSGGDGGVAIEAINITVNAGRIVLTGGDGGEGGDGSECNRSEITGKGSKDVTGGKGGNGGNGGNGIIANTLTLGNNTNVIQINVIGGAGGQTGKRGGCHDDDHSGFVFANGTTTATDGENGIAGTGGLAISAECVITDPYNLIISQDGGDGEVDTELNQS